MSEQMPSEPSEPAAPPFAHATLVVIALIHLGLGVLGLLATIAHLRDGWLQIHTNAGLLVVAIGLLIRSHFWRRVARWVDYGIALLLLLFALAGFLLSDFRIHANLPIALRRNAVLLCVLVCAILFWWMGRRLGAIRSICSPPTTRWRWFHRVVLIGFLAISIATGGSLITYSTGGYQSSGFRVGLLENEKRILWEQGFRDPALVEFRYLTYTRYGLFTKLEITVTKGGYTSSYEYSRFGNADADPQIAQVQATGDFIVCEIELDVEPRWKLLGKGASVNAKTQIRGVGKYEGYRSRSDDSAELNLTGLVSQEVIESQIHASIEQQLMRGIMRNATPPPEKKK